MTKHQALYNLLTKKLKYKKNIEIESGFEGDNLWVDDNEPWEFMKKSDAYEGWEADEELERTKIYEQDGWLFWKDEDKYE